MIKRLLLAGLLALATSSAWAQNPQCPTRPETDNSNACASTAFVQSRIDGTFLIGTPPIVVNYASPSWTISCNNFTSGLAGCVPASGGGTTNFLRADGTWAVPGSSRTRLVADTSFNICAACTYTSPEALYNHARDNIDTAGYNVIGQLTDASLTTNSVLSGPLTGGGRFILRGDTTTPGNRILTATTVSHIIELYEATLYLEGVKFTHSGGGGTAVFARRFSLVVINANNEFGGGAGTVDIALQAESQLIRRANYIVSGTGTRHISGSSNSNVSTDSDIQTTVTGSTRTEAFAWSHASARLCFRAGETFVGTMTGPKFFLEEGGHIFTDGAGLSFLPGTIAGTFLDAASTYDGYSGILKINYNATDPEVITGAVAYFTGSNSGSPVGVWDSYAGLSSIIFRRANGTQAAKSALALHDQIGGISARGYGTSAYSAGRGAFDFWAAEAWTNSANGTYATIRLASIGGTTLNEIMRWTGNGISSQVAITAPSLTLTTTPLPYGSGGTGVTTPVSYVGASGTWDMNTTADQPITITLPAGVVNYKVLQVLVYNASIPLTTAAGGIYVSAGKAGTQVVPSSQTYSGITATAADTLASLLSLSATNFNTLWLQDTTLFFSLTTPQGAAATAKYVIYVQPLP